MEVPLLRAVENGLQNGRYFLWVNHRKIDGSTRDAWFVQFWKEIQPGYPRGGRTQVILHFFINETINMHLLDNFFDFGGIKGVGSFQFFGSGLRCLHVVVFLLPLCNHSI